ncbi:MAG TPA: hypothetical protein P5181_06660 [Dermatophilaceae bacterium]|nr:hypothetical protein [Dermatophilaceae bacterium]
MSRVRRTIAALDVLRAPVRSGLYATWRGRQVRVASAPGGSTDWRLDDGTVVPVSELRDAHRAQTLATCHGTEVEIERLDEEGADVVVNGRPPWSIEHGGSYDRSGDETRVRVAVAELSEPRELISSYEGRPWKQ